MPRNAEIAVSSCCRVAGSSLPMIRSTFCASERTASSKPTRLSAGVRLRSASRTSARPRSSPASAVGIDASGGARMIDPLRQRLDFDLQRFHRVPRQRFGDLAADLGELLAEARDDLFEIIGRPQRFDPRGDVAQLLFEIAAGRSVSIRAVILRNCSSSLEMSSAGAAARSAERRRSGSAAAVVGLWRRTTAIRGPLPAAVREAEPPRAAARGRAPVQSVRHKARAGVRRFQRSRRRLKARIRRGSHLRPGRRHRPVAMRCRRSAGQTPYAVVQVASFRSVVSRGGLCRAMRSS